MMAFASMHIVEQHHLVRASVDQAEGITYSFRGAWSGGERRNPDLLEIASSGQNLAILIDDRHPCLLAFLGAWYQVNYATATAET
jgi:hypothetical protein